MLMMILFTILFNLLLVCVARCSDLIEGSCEWGASNHVMQKLITEYDNILLNEGEMSQYSPSFKFVSGVTF